MSTRTSGKTLVIADTLYAMSNLAGRIESADHDDVRRIALGLDERPPTSMPTTH